MNDAKKIAKLSSTTAYGKYRRCRPSDPIQDEELGFELQFCEGDEPNLREPIKQKRKSTKKKCKQYRWVDTKKGRECVCSATGQRVPQRYCGRKAR